MDQVYQIHSSTDASRIVTDELGKKNIKVQSFFTHKTINGVHIDLIDELNKIKYHIKFAKEPFITFGNYFPQYKDEYGETLDESVLDKLNDNDVLLFAYPDKILMCIKKEFIKPNLWRMTKYGIKTCSFPLCNLEVFIGNFIIS